MHEEIMIQNQKAQAAVTWAMVGRLKSGFIGTWLVDRNNKLLKMTKVV